MDRGTYAAASAGMVKFRELEVINHNLANTNTVGYKRQILVSEKEPFEDTLASKIAAGDPFAKGDHERVPTMVSVETVTDFSQGPLKQTGNPLDVALRNENEFFVVNTPDGPQYTRAGNFTVGNEGLLVTSDGMPLAGEIIINGPDARIGPDGTVTAGGQTVGKLQVVKFEDPSVLEPAGATRFKIKDGAEGAPEQVQPELEPFTVEMSNVSVISAVVQLIAANRGFEAYTKTAKAIDEMNQSGIQRIPGRG
ncbi:MAG: flagellar hook-basal body protein [Candidatus Dadabacteria bacterium]|nr:MAG: flagellar hook-basal body protein [Candidatus Dadabacteria bacterium]